MKIVGGRSNLALTVHVPENCANNCAFCTSKELYHGLDDNSLELFKGMIKQAGKLPGTVFKDLVISGGEPMVSDYVEDIIESLDVPRPTFINTSFINHRPRSFLKMIARHGCIRGINISRHCETFEQDARMLNNILPDDRIREIHDTTRASVKINVVCPENPSPEFVSNLVRRWSGIADIISLRSDYRKVNIRDLHRTDAVFDMLIDSPDLVFTGHSFCRACDTVSFQGDGLVISYHKGVVKTSFMNAAKDELEINDLVIYPDGTLCYDWDKECAISLRDLKRGFGLPAATPKRKETPRQHAIPFAIDEQPRGGCGYTRRSYGGGCGSGGGASCGSSRGC